jgi:hypothetical protein
MIDHNLEARWLAGDEEAAGTLAAGMTASELRTFGTEALAACCESVEAPRPVLDVVNVGRNDPRLGHAAFDAVRELTLRVEAKGDAAAPALLCAAENVARVIYNSTTPDDPFDADAELYVFKSFAAFCLSLKPQAREMLEQQLRRVLESTRQGGGSPVDVRSIRLSKLESRWLTGDPETCRALAAEMTQPQLRLFAVDALSACCAVAANVPSPVLRVIEAGRSAPGSARVAFGAVHELRLAAEVSQAVTLDARLLRVAESAARVIYNSTMPDGAFERASDEWLLQAAAGFHYASPTEFREQLGERLRQALAAAMSTVASSH